MHTNYMEKKKNIRYSNSIRSFSGLRHELGYVLGRIYNSKNNFGFTLVELLIVITIISVLAGGVLIALDPAKRIKQARDSVRKSDLHQIQAALEQYRADKGSYPTAGFPPACGNQFTDGTVVYIKSFPCPPGGGVYSYSSTGTTYTLTATLEEPPGPYEVYNP